MNIFKIAFRSLQFRLLGTTLTVLSMALGVMMVVSVLSVYGLVSESFRSNSSFGFNLLTGARGGGLQLTLNSVYYLSRPIENIPYEYYLAFQNADVREPQLKNSLAYRALELEQQTAWAELQSQSLPGMVGWNALARGLVDDAWSRRQLETMKLEKAGLFSYYVDYAIPILLGDYFEVPSADRSFRVCATNRDFFDKLVLDIDSDEHFAFEEGGRAFDNNDLNVGYFGAILGAMAAKQSGLKVGDQIQVTHGVPGEGSSHLHEQYFEITGILKTTGTPNDRVVFVNLEGFYLINDHIKPIEDDSMLKGVSEDEENPKPPTDEDDEDIFADGLDDQVSVAPFGDKLSDRDGIELPMRTSDETLSRYALPIEQREITALLIRTRREGDEYGTGAMALQPMLDGGKLESSLNWSSFRPINSQTTAQCVFPVQQVETLFSFFVDPARWVLLGLTILICVVSGLSILVGIYNSMSQRHHEIAVMRALGARRSQVMSIMLAEAILLGVAGGLVGWVAGHGLNAVLGPMVENQTGVPVSFWDFAPPEPVFSGLAPLFGDSSFANYLVKFRVSPELLLIPGLVLLAIVVGVYPAVSAYRTDVAKSLGK